MRKTWVRPMVGKIPREGKGYPLQYPGLENFVDCIVRHKVSVKARHTKSQTQLSDFHFHFFSLSPTSTISLSQSGILPCLKSSKALLSWPFPSCLWIQVVCCTLSPGAHLGGENSTDLTLSRSYPGDLVVKNPPANAGRTGWIPGSERSPGGGDGNPLQYSCLENPMDRGAWQATVHAVARSWTWLSDSTTVTPWHASGSLHMFSLLPQLPFTWEGGGRQPIHEDLV